MANKIMVSFLFVVCGIIRAELNQQRDHEGSISTKAISPICASSAHNEFCEQSLMSVSRNPNVIPKDYLLTILQATLNEVHKSLNTTSNMVIDQGDQDLHDNMGLQDCVELLGYAIGQLEAAISLVHLIDIHAIQDRVEDFKAWLTGVYTYQSTCVDQLQKTEYKVPVQNALFNATRMSEYAFLIFSQISSPILTDALNIKPSTKPPSQLRQLHLLGHGDGDEAGKYRWWVSASNRKLLETRQSEADPVFTPNAVVAQDGSGQFRTINEAVAAIPQFYQGRFIIYVKAGLYREVVRINMRPNVFMYGDGQGKTIVSGDLGSVATILNSPTIGVDADDFMIKSMTIRNTAGPLEGQAVALRINGERAIVYDCRIQGYQDTLFYHKGVQFYTNCLIFGTVDFIFGHGRAVIQDSTIVVMKPLKGQFNTITADGGQLSDGTNGLVLQNCKIVPDNELYRERGHFKTYLGRPWKRFSKTVIMESEIRGFIDPKGYIPMNAIPPNHNEDTAFFGEFANTGNGAATYARDINRFKNWRLLSPQEAANYTVGAFLRGADFLPDKGVPYKPDL